MERIAEKRILIFTYWDYHDALIQTYTLPYVKIMVENPNLSVWLVCLQTSNRKISKEELTLIQHSLNPYRIHLVLFDYKPLSLAGYINTASILLKLFYLTLKLRIDIIHAWATPSGALSYLIARLLGKTLIVDSYEPHAEPTLENGTWGKNSLPFRFLFLMEKLQSHYAKVVIAVTERMRDYAMMKYNKTFDSNFYVKPACVDFNLFDFREENLDLKESLGLSGKIVGIYAGKFGGIYLDTEFFRWITLAIQHWGDQFRLLLLTSHSQSEILKYCNEQGINPDVICQRFVPHHEVPVYMSMADFAFSIVKPVPSKRYCSPIKDGEYWAMGLPVVITKDISDDSDIISKEGIGYVLQDLNEDEYIKSIYAIEKLIQDQALSDRIIEVAQRYRSFEIARKVYRNVYPY